MPKLILAIASEQHHAGNGTADDPFRMITTYHTPDGDLLAEVDPWLAHQREKVQEGKAALSDFVTFFQTTRDLLQRCLDVPVPDDPARVWPILRNLIEDTTESTTTGPKGGGISEIMRQRYRDLFAQQFPGEPVNEEMMGVFCKMVDEYWQEMRAKNILPDAQATAMKGIVEDAFNILHNGKVSEGGVDREYVMNHYKGG